MNGTSVKGSSCLALTEKKKNQRPGGCIGVFFQLFDWNRRFTKKRFFSKKLLPPARAKQVSPKKFKGDEKMLNSKLNLIADENNGGFPKGGYSVVDTERKHEMGVPGLVARLMGLESIPASQRDRSKESSFSDSCGDDREKESSGNHNSEADNQEVELEMVVSNAKKNDSSRPHKLQKTGTHERRVIVTRFGSEALQIKSVLSRARKYNNHHHHHPKLASPLKSPRISSGKSASRSSRLIGAATKILEPGLQATSRAKCSLTSSTSINNGIVTERIGTRPSDIENQYGYDASIAKSLMGHTCCKNYGNLLDPVDYRPEIEGPQAVPVPNLSSYVFTATSLESSQKGRSFIPSHENDIVLLRSLEKLMSIVNEDGKNNAESCNESSTSRRMSLLVNRDSSCQPCGALEDDDEASSFAFKHKTQTQERVLSSEKISYESRKSNVQVKRVSSAASAVSGTKDFVALNRSLSGQPRMKSPTKVDSSKFSLERKPSNRQDCSLSRVSALERKRRTPNVSQAAGTASINLVTVKQKSVSSGAQGGKRRGFDSSSPKSSDVKGKRGAQQNTYKVNENKINELVTLTLSAPSKQKMEILGEMEETGGDNEIKTCFQRPPPLRADALGAFLEQKLKELSSRENEELDTDGPSKKSTVMILQELISALNSQHLISSDDHVFNDRDRANNGILLGTYCNDNHLSPGSVLEASFSSSSRDESSGHGFDPDSMNCSCDQQEQFEHDAELLDSATSFNKGKICYEILSELVNQIPRILQSLNSIRKGLTESKFTHMKNVILNAELVLGNATKLSEDEVPQLLISCFLPDELDTMASDAMWTNFNGFVDCDYEESKERNQLKGFLFDCVIEYLELNCCRHYNSVFQAWKKLPLCMKAKMLAQVVKSEIRKWACLAGMVPDEIIEWEMSHSLGKWTDFNIEAFEAGVDIDGDVLQILVEEIVEDLVLSSPSSCY